MTVQPVLTTCSAVFALASIAAALQVSTTRLSVATGGAQGNNLSFEARISVGDRPISRPTP